jgi:hypothetical protein
MSKNSDQRGPLITFSSQPLSFAYSTAPTARQA